MPGWKIEITAWSPATDMASTLRRSLAIEQAVAALSAAGLLDVVRVDKFVARRKTGSAPSDQAGTSTPAQVPPAEVPTLSQRAEGAGTPLGEALASMRATLDAAGVVFTLDDESDPGLPTEFPTRDSPRSEADTVAEIGRQVRDGVTGGRAAE